MNSLSPVTITALAEVIAGEARSKDGASLGGKVRSARAIQRFMMEFGVDFSDPWSRVKDLRKCLQNLSDETIHRVIVGAFDSHSFDKNYVSDASLVYLNRFLKEDGLELVITDGKPELNNVVGGVQESEHKLSPQQLEKIRNRRQKFLYRKEFGPDFGWFINILLLLIVLPFLLLKYLFTQGLNIIVEIIGIAFKYLKTAIGILIALAVLVYFIYPSIPQSILNHILNSPKSQLFP